MTRRKIEQIALDRISNAIKTQSTKLSLRELGLTSLPPDVEKLELLESLDISNNNLTTLPSFIGKFSYLKQLDVRNNELSSLPKEIGRLSRLERLDLRENNLSSLPQEIRKLTNLAFLYADENRFTSLPNEIGTLHKLQVLSLERGYKNDEYQISQLPIEIGDLIRLKSLNMSGQNLTQLPVELARLENLEELQLQDNPLPIPPEILVRIYEPKAILNFYLSLRSTKRRLLHEVKVLIVGQGSVGKTSLLYRILHGTFDKNQTKTEGISINQWQVDGGLKTEDGHSSSSVNDQSSIKLNIWDFGGQEIMHATHQFFLTKRSLYLLVLDARLTQEENRVEYWLKIIQSFGGESPVLIVGNKTDQHPLDIDRTGLQKKYPNIVGILESSAATGAGIDALKTEIAKQVDTLPHVRDLLPETWFTVKSKLEELGRDKNFITQDEYLGLCATNDVTDEISQHTLLGFLHDLGVVLHFQDDLRLEGLGILNPQWVTNGVYKILNSHELFQNQGKLTLPMLNKILDLPEYPKDKHLFIVDMMKKFELCYDIESDKSFLIPDLLPKGEPFTGEWDGALAFQIHYNVLPSSIISRFIVRMNSFIHKTIWRSGIVLKRGDNTALVKADIEDRKVYIWVNGKEDTRRGFLSMIRGEFEAIHQTIAKIEAVEKIPLPNAPEATPVDLEFLQRLASEGRESLPVQAGNQIIDLIVKEVLSRIETDSKRVEVHIHGDMKESNLVVGDKNKVKSESKKKRK